MTIMGFGMTRNHGPVKGTGINSHCFPFKPEIISVPPSTARKYTFTKLLRSPVNTKTPWIKTLLRMRLGPRGLGSKLQDCSPKARLSKRDSKWKPPCRRSRRKRGHQELEATPAAKKNLYRGLHDYNKVVCGCLRAFYRLYRVE